MCPFLLQKILTDFLTIYGFLTEQLEMQNKVSNISE